MHYIFISQRLDYTFIPSYYDSTNTFVETDVEYLHMQLQMPLLCIDSALSRHQGTFCVN
jgi:hypothetical protein